MTRKKTSSRSKKGGNSGSRKTGKSPPPASSVALINSSESELLGYEGLGPGDFIVPRFKIVQPVSREGTPGHFRCNVTEEEVGELVCAVLTVRKGMVLFAEGNEARALCRSRDALEPDPAIEDPVSEVCAVMQGQRLVPLCEKAKFVGSQPPECRLTYNVLGLRLDSPHPEPFLISLYGTSLRPVRLFLSICRQRRRHLFDVRTTLRLSEVTNTKGRFYVVSFEEIEDMEPLGAFSQLFEELSSYDPTTTFEAEEAANSDEVPF